MCNSLSSDSPQRKFSSSNCLLETARKEHSDDTLFEAEQELTRRLALTASTRAVLPSDDLSVHALLDISLPTVSSVAPSIKPEQCFSDHPPTESVIVHLSRPVPPANFVSGLHNVARQAMLNGKLSIKDWTFTNSMSFFSFELIEFWNSLTKIIHAQREWGAALQWLEQATRDEVLDKEVREVHLILRTTPWNAELRILRSRVTFLEMATFLSNGWLSSSQIDMALSSIATRQLRISGEQERVIISLALLSSPNSYPLHHSYITCRTKLYRQILTVYMPREIFNVLALILHDTARLCLLHTLPLATGPPSQLHLRELWSGQTP